MQNHLPSPRQSFLPPIPELEQAADLLSEAADALLQGKHEVARERLRLADMPVVHSYAARIMGKWDADVHRFRPETDLPPPSHLTKAAERMPSHCVSMAIYQRDGFHCRFCGCRVVLGTARSVMRALVPDALPWGKKSSDLHAAFFALTATIDHLVPHSRGGDNEHDNLLTTCWPCNFGRGNALIEEVGLLDPRNRPPHATNWDGLGRILAIGSPRPTEAPDLAFQTVSCPGKTGSPKPAKKQKVTPEAWFDELDRLPGRPSTRLRGFLNTVDSAGLSWGQNDYIVIGFDTSAGRINPIGLDRSGYVNLPWDVGPYKKESRVFAERVAAAIPDAAPYETPKTWGVQRFGRQLSVLELLDASEDVLLALEHFKVSTMR